MMKLLFFMHLVCFIHLFCQTGASHVTPTVGFVEYALVIKAHGLLGCFFFLPSILLLFKRSINIIILIDCALGHQSTSCWPVLVHVQNSKFNNLQKSNCRSIWWILMLNRNNNISMHKGNCFYSNSWKKKVWYLYRDVIVCTVYRKSSDDSYSL